ncbi:MAG: ROK family protein [Candidatus Latescibacteria bacterium]|nr:ROK family protein [Candidatus Latescibacterota bacterium]
MPNTSPLFGALEAGGTKFICAVGTAPDDIRAQSRIDTQSPAATLEAVIDFFRRSAAEHGPMAAVGIGSFGPVDLHPDSPAYGHITTTPKPGWAHTDLVGPLQAALDVPVGFDTDVNAAALGEYRWGAAQGLDTFIYLTIGTGIGGGGLVEGRLLHGLLHPEMGHIPLPRDTTRDPYQGYCPFHGDCFEGLASGPALEDRWGLPADQLPPDHPAWSLQAHYLAVGLASFIYTLSPQRLVLGGGVMDQAHLFPLVRQELATLINGYLQIDELDQGLDQFVVPPGLGPRAGLCGALVLAAQALEAS